MLKFQAIPAQQNEYGYSFIDEGGDLVSLMRQPLIYFLIECGRSDEIKATPACTPGEMFPPDFIRRYDGSFVNATGDTSADNLLDMMKMLGYEPAGPSTLPVPLDDLSELGQFMWRPIKPHGAN